MKNLDERRRGKAVKKKNLKRGRAMLTVYSDDFLLTPAVKLRLMLKLAYLDSSCFGDCQVIPRLEIFHSFGSTLKKNVKKRN